MPTKMLPLPSFDRLDELLTYDPEDGRIRWKINRSNVKSGSTAGCIRTTRNGRREWEIKINGKMYTSTRIIWALYHHVDPGSFTIDHIDRNPLNNRIANLRLATVHQQNMNTKRTSPSTATRYLGLVMSSYKDRNWRPRWQGKIRISGCYYSFGSASVNSINDNPPQWLIDRANHIYAMRDDPAITDEALIEEISRIQFSASRRR